MDMKVFVVFALLAYGVMHFVGSKPSIVCPPMPVECICKGKLVYKTMETRLLEDDQYIGTICVTKDDPFQVCEDDGCQFNETRLDVPPGEDNQTSNGNLTYPIGYVLPLVEVLKRTRQRGLGSDETTVDSGNPDYNDHGGRYPRRVVYRINRPSRPCYMKPLYSANVACWSWGYYFSCNVTCIPGYGHTVNNTSVRTWNTRCHFGSNTWYPRAYDDCEPVGRNCDVELTGTGTLICTSPTEEHRYCDVECYADIFREKSTNVSFARYPCTSDNYANELPWCATLRNVSAIKEPDYPYEDIYTYTGNYY